MALIKNARLLSVAKKGFYPFPATQSLIISSSLIVPPNILVNIYGKKGNRTPQELWTHRLAGDSTYQCKQSLIGILHSKYTSLIFSLYQTRTGTDYAKGSCTTVILKDLNITIFLLKQDLLFPYALSCL